MPGGVGIKPHQFSYMRIILDSTVFHLTAISRTKVLFKLFQKEKSHNLFLEFFFLRTQSIGMGSSPFWSEVLKLAHGIGRIYYRNVTRHYKRCWKGKWIIKSLPTVWASTCSRYKWRVCGVWYRTWSKPLKRKRTKGGISVATVGLGGEARSSENYHQTHRLKFKIFVTEKWQHGIWHKNTTLIPFRYYDY